MLKHKIEIRVRYPEVDRMGFLFHGHYMTYFDSARNEFMRDLGMCNLDFEESGIMFPVLHIDITYINAAHYDDLLTIETTLERVEGVRIFFHHEVFNPKGELITKADVTLTTMGSESKRAMRPPKSLLDLINKKVNES